ncbi:hypothetical protein L248_3001 [Schleiferilactobacillus shenzhenensis LY-73]|uniref:Uncharacterized protein n=1 Tax=Schleiferilactobacillus shenzhenensis LY-73 TaxID=1231336 RepID=U4TT52_9LACO|nr:hypothetical protein L248_3001 [Schleiferilactobacillus shenzhenensis LY-73]
MEDDHMNRMTFFKKLTGKTARDLVLELAEITSVKTACF